MHDVNHNRIRGLASLIGNTPLLAVQFKYRGQDRTIYAKAENLNMTGSIKDRMTFHILEKAYARQMLKPGSPIIEATSGNTGISFAAIGRALGHPVNIFMPDWMSTERINLIRSLGAEISLVSKQEGGFLGSIRNAEELAGRLENAFLPRQFSNEDNIEAHYQTTGPEIWWQLRFRALTPDAFVAGVGTGGTIMMSQKLAAELGIGVGISSGANFLGALLVQEQLGPDAIIVTLFPDDNKKYLSTDLLGTEPMNDGFLTPEVQLEEIRAIKRVCYTCCDPDECMHVSTIDIMEEMTLPHCPRRGRPQKAESH